MKAALLIGFGGPTKMEEVRPFLDNVLRGRTVPKERYEEVVKQYERIGGASPYNQLTSQLADHLKKNLRTGNAEIPIYIGMRNWSPFLGDVLWHMTMDGVREAAGVILSPFRSEPSWDRYIQVVEESRRSIGPGAPVVHYLDPWHENPFFIEALADRITEAQAPFSPERQQNAHWIFTAHSIPVALDHASGYSRQIARAAEMTANLLGHKEWTSAYQSRSGRPEDAWLEPDIGDVLRSLSGSSKKDVVAIPIGFVMDHVEVLYDLDIKAREAAVSAGLHFLRAKTVGTHQSFLRVLSDGIRRTLKLSETSPLPG